MNEMLNAFLRGIQEGARAYFAPVRWTARALSFAANDAFGQPCRPETRKPSR